jgi:4-carboxymuconolactone decarboxylase
MLAPSRADALNAKFLAAILRWRRKGWECASAPTPHTLVEQADLLPRRMAALGLDANTVARVEPITFRDLQTLCATCGWYQLCQWDLGRDDPIEAASRKYCPNSAMFAALVKNPRLLNDKSAIGAVLIHLAPRGPATCGATAMTGELRTRNLFQNLALPAPLMLAAVLAAVLLAKADYGAWAVFGVTTLLVLYVLGRLALEGAGRVPALARAVTAPHAIGKEPRLPPLAMDQLNDKQKPLGEQIMNMSSVGLGGPYNPMLRSPVLGQRMFDLLYYLRRQTSVPLKLNEFAILIIGRQWRSQVEWFAHAPLAIKAGLSPEIVAELKTNRRPPGMPPEESAVYDFVTELTTKHVVSDETFNRARQLLGEQQVVDLTAVAGAYITVAMMLAMAEESVPPGKELPFKPSEP